MDQSESNPIISRVFEWLALENGENFLTEQEHCLSRDVFQGRLDHFSREIEQIPLLSKQFSLVIAVAGEIGNNAFDHNLGSWRDIAGVYFGVDHLKRELVIADRGQGVLASLKRTIPDLYNDQTALNTAFTEIISGRAPERRGNGLKFVATVIHQAGFSLEYYSGVGRYFIGHNTNDYAPEKVIKGVIAIVRF